MKPAVPAGLGPDIWDQMRHLRGKSKNFSSLKRSGFLMELKYLLSRLSTGAKMDHVKLIPFVTLSCLICNPEY